MGKKRVNNFYLPTYSPQLNIIEILWRFIKYSWLNTDAYES
ncbi:MAG: transposase [Hormoscilla sp. GM102CHS1]|nr:transposase [Hormoscilla sp. GM102CHS1]